MSLLARPSRCSASRPAVTRRRSLAPEPRAHVLALMRAEVPQQCLRALVEHVPAARAGSRRPDRRGGHLRRDGTPRSRSRRRWPDCVPGGTRSRTGPSKVGNLEPAPRAPPRDTATGTTRCRSSPSRRNSGSGATWTVTYRSARFARRARRRGPCPPRARNRRRPFRAGHRPAPVRCGSRRPAPSHAPHASWRCRPVPPQRPQVLVKTMWPRAERIVPAPRRPGTSFRATATAPRPRQRRQATCRTTVRRRVGAAHRFVEPDRQDRVEVGAGGRFGGEGLRRLLDHVGEEVPECRRRGRWSDSTEKSNPSNPNVGTSAAGAAARRQVVLAPAVRIRRASRRPPRRPGTASAAARSPGLMSG